MSQQSSGNPALRFGAIFGLGWGVVLIANYYVANVLGVRFTTLATLVISLVVYLVAGMLAAAQTGNVSTGLVAGLWTGLFSSLLDAAGVITILLIDHALVVKLRLAAEQAAQRAAARTGVPPRHIGDGLVIIGEVIGVVFGTLIATAVGLGMGALGGAIGRSRAPAPQAYQESLYPGFPPPAQGQTPGAFPPPPPPGQGSWPRQGPRENPPGQGQ